MRLLTSWFALILLTTPLFAQPTTTTTTAPDTATPGAPGTGAPIHFQMPQPGHATLVINDANGIRVRNLLADTPFPAGDQSAQWDGLDDNGQPLPPGSYHWAGLFRGDLHAVYRGSFTPGSPPWVYGSTGGWTADHSYPVAVASTGSRILIGSTEAEWGHGLIATDPDGKKIWGTRWLSAKPWAGADTLATVGNRVFAASLPSMNTIWEVDPDTGDNHPDFDLTDIPKDQQNTTSRLTGFQITPVGLRIVGGRKLPTGALDGELYVTDFWGQTPRTYVLSTNVTKKKQHLPILRTLPVRPWSLAFLSDGRCLAVMDQSVDLLDPQTGATTPFITGLSAPYAITVDAKDRLYISDQGGDDDVRFNPNSSLPQRALRTSPKASNQVKIYDSTGKFLRAIGREGGRLIGAYNPQDLYRPAALAIDSNQHLWITEFTFEPKRISLWNIPADLTTQSPTLLKEFVGPTTYGGGAAMIDPQQPWQIMDTNYGVLFNVDLTTNTYNPIDIPWRQYLGRKGHTYRPLLPFDGKPTTVFTIDNRRFSFLQGGYEHGPEAHWQPYTGSSDACVIGEYRNNIFVPEAAIGNIRMLLRARELTARTEEQWLPAPLLAAAKLRPDWPALAKSAGMDPNETDAPHVTHVRNTAVFIASPWPTALSGFIWTDANADGQMQPEEIQLFDIRDTDQITFDSQLNAYLTLVPRYRDDVVTYRLPRIGFYPSQNGLPDGPPIYRWANAQKIPGNIYVSQVGKDGSLLSMNSLHDSAGKELWSYPAGGPAKTTPKDELLAPGRMGRLHAFRGIVNAPNDLGQVFMVHSTDGMSYLLTRDGLFIATLFKPWNLFPGWDSIPTATPGMNLEDYSLQDECFNGSFTQALASGQGFAQNHYYLLGLGRSAVVELTGLDSVHRLPGGDLTLTTPAPAAHPKSTIPINHPAPPIVATAAFGPPVHWADTTASLSWDKDALHIKYQVAHATMINNEKDWTLLFSTGDVCDLQLQSPTLGKCRYMFTVFNNQPTTIRFSYDAKTEINPTTYKSGILETHIPAVEQLPLTPTITRTKDTYQLEITLPWTTLGITPHPGLRIPLELGIIHTNPTGTRATSRDYYHANNTGMVSDLPTEARPTDNWGVLQLR